MFNVVIFSTEICLEAHLAEITREFLITILKIWISEYIFEAIDIF